jgi:hypothetical protein
MKDNIKDYLIVKDNFFKKNIYKKIINEMLQLNFINRNIAVDKKDQNIYQKTYFSVNLNFNHFAVQEVKKNLNKCGFNVIEFDHNYLLSTKHEEATPHIDKSNDLNCLIYLKGTQLINSGTGFYDKTKNNYELNRHIGFKENRAIIFDAKIFHASLQFNEGAKKRYVMANFFRCKQ